MPKKGKFITTSTFFPFYLPCSNGARCHDLSFLIFSLKGEGGEWKSWLIKRFFSSSLFFVIRVASSTYLSLLFPSPILILACNSSSPEFLMVCSVYRLNKQGDRQPCCTPFSTLNQSVVPYRLLTVASWPAYRFLRRQVRWSGIPIYPRAIHSLSWYTVKGFRVVNET